MAGNVWEWTSSLKKSYPYQTEDGREDMSSRDLHILRGGSFLNHEIGARAAYRYYNYPNTRDPNFGFRVGMAAGPGMKAQS